MCNVFNYNDANINKSSSSYVSECRIVTLLMICYVSNEHFLSS